MRISDLTGLHRVFHAGPEVSRARIVFQFEELLAERGIQRALAFLNSRTRYRCTSISRFDVPMLRNAFVFDRRQPNVLFGGTSQVLDDTYAALVQHRKQAFRTDDALHDGRLGYHTARALVQSYLGVPIRLAGGALWGVLAHHDHAPRTAPAGEADLLRDVTSAVARWLKPDGVGLDDAPGAL